LVKVNSVKYNCGHKVGGRQTTGLYWKFFKDIKKYKQEFTNYPKDVLYYNKDTKDVKHPTQKPISLCEYLIRTYSNPGEVILDNTCGYATTGVASIRSGRRFICMEKESEWYEKSAKRLNKVSKKHKQKNWWRN